MTKQQGMHLYSSENYHKFGVFFFNGLFKGIHAEIILECRLVLLIPVSFDSKDPSPAVCFLCRHLSSVALCSDALLVFSRAVAGHIMCESTETRGFPTSGAPTSETSPPRKTGQTCRDINALNFRDVEKWGWTLDSFHSGHTKGWATVSRS